MSFVKMTTSSLSSSQGSLIYKNRAGGLLPAHPYYNIYWYTDRIQDFDG